MRVAASALVGTAVLCAAASSVAQTPPAPGAATPPVEALPPPATPSAPPPPPPGMRGAQEPATSTGPLFGPESERPAAQDALFGFKDGFFLRDRRDHFRLYPLALLEADFHAPFGPGVSAVAASNGGSDLKTKLLIRRARFGLEAEILRRWSVNVTGELGPQAVANATGQPGSPTQATETTGSLADAWVNYRLCNCFSLMVGQFNTPLGIENRTPDAYTPFPERNVAIRGLVAPGSKDVGAMAWGFFGDRVISYELGAFGGDGPNRPTVDSRFDFIGRVFARPLAAQGHSDFERTAQIGVSARLGARDAASVGYDVPAITTGDGFPLWNPTYVDHAGRTIHVIPSAGQTTVGGELRAEAFRVALQAEAYYVDDHTREAVDGFQLTNTERLGALKGAGWYVQLSGWPLGDSKIRPEPGIIAPRQVDLHGVDASPRGLELLASFAGINAKYDGASRQGTADANAPPTKVTVYELGVAAQYWYTQHVRMALDYELYVTPGSGTSNAATVPDNLVTRANGTTGEGHVMHELGLRLTVAL